MVVGNIVIGDHFRTCHFFFRITLSRTHTHIHTHDVTDLAAHSSLSHSFANLFSSDKLRTISQLFDSHVPKIINILDVKRLRNYEQLGAWQVRLVMNTAWLGNSGTCMLLHDALQESLLTAVTVCFCFFFCRHVNHSVNYVSSERKANIIYRDIDFGRRNLSV